MSIELARRLMRSGLVAAHEIEHAIEQASVFGVPFLRTLFERSPGLVPLVERELRQSKLPAIHTVRAVPELAARLPNGMCERLLAIPVREDGRTSSVDVVTVDPFDSHIPAEFSFHLGVGVRMLRASYADVCGALDALDQAWRAGSRVRDPLATTMPLGTRADRGAEMQQVIPRSERPATVSGSEPPIPLVRKTSSTELRRVTAPMLDLLQDEDGEPVLGLYRSKVPTPVAPPAVQPEPEPQPQPVSDAPSAKPSEGQWPQTPESSEGVPSDEVSALELVMQAHSPEELAQRLVTALGVVAPRVVVLAVKGKVYEGRVATRTVGPIQRVRELRLPAGQPSVVEQAISAGCYLGPIPDQGGQAQLMRLLRAGKDDAYIVPVDVSGRPALIVALAGFENAFGSTQRCDRLVKAASGALERILRERKRGA